MNTGYDVIVVGARCAGSPTAMLLARRGHRVLLADRASFPSDTVSTLIIHSPGIAALDRWGLLDDLAATGCPPVQRYIFDFGPLVIDGRPYPGDGTSVAYAPRRTILDKILIDAADRAGAEVREGFTVEDVLIEDGAVAGVRGHGTGGPSVIERARVVVGADGHNSRIGRAVSAAPYHGKPVLERAYYTYWSGLPVDGFTTYIRGDRGIAAIPTNDELTLVLVGVPIAQANDFKRDLEASYLAAIDREPEFAKKIRKLELKAGAQKYTEAATGISTATRDPSRRAPLAEQAELSYKRLVQDQQAGAPARKVGASATLERASK